MHLDVPQTGVPERLFHYPSMTLSKDFAGDWISNPVAIGSYTLTEHIAKGQTPVDQRERYWRKSQDDEGFRHVDSIRLINLGTDPAAAVAALTEGKVDLISISAPLLETVGGSEDIVIPSTPSSYTQVIRMRGNGAPVDDVQGRNAVKAWPGDRKPTRKAATGADST
ncbi:MAG: ABC transporter substrate-binding protein [Anaerolineae bacterium]|nr:ABC transporter substrate-binding protein [Anaerolineae bacterium]